MQLEPRSCAPGDGHVAAGLDRAWYLRGMTTDTVARVVDSSVEALAELSGAHLPVPRVWAVVTRDPTRLTPGSGACSCSVLWHVERRRTIRCDRCGTDYEPTSR